MIWHLLFSVEGSKKSYEIVPIFDLDVILHPQFLVPYAIPVKGKLFIMGGRTLDLPNPHN